MPRRRRTETLRQQERESGVALVDDRRVRLRLIDDHEAARPRTRGDCEDGQRPCAWVRCRHNLYLDITRAGSIQFNFPDREPEDMPADFSCALDVADNSGATLEDVGEIMNLTRERVRQIEERGLVRLQRGGALRQFSGAPAGAPKPSRHGRLRSGLTRGDDPAYFDGEDEAPPSEDDYERGSFLDGTEAAAAARVWGMVERVYGLRRQGRR
jgi:hypothetical protein